MQPVYKGQRAIRIADVAGGLNDTSNETLLKPNQTPRCENIDFDTESISSSKGAVKFNNQTAPRGSIRTRVDPALSPLYFAPNMAVPLRGYGYFPYDQDSDFGGKFDFEGTFEAGTQTFHNRRGHSGEINVSFLIPPEEKLYEAETRGSSAPAVGAEAATYNPPLGFDEALDECFIVLQKGGDRTAPMSWAIGVVNVGKGVGLASLPAQRPSNYALVFMWYDAPQWGQGQTLKYKYNLTTAQSPVGGAAFKYGTLAYRAILIHKYVEPGRRYSVSVGLKLDTGTPGGVASNTAWNHDGTFKVWVSEDHGTPGSYTFVDSSGGGAASGLEVIKGPSDSLSYLAKYGVRYAGRDALFIGQGMRFFPWQTPGFLPFGMDCTPLKNGGFQMVDRSANTAATLYGGGIYTLTASHPVGANIYLSVNHLGLTNGNTNGGISPFATGAPGSYLHWTGLGDGAVTFNTQALRGYRAVFPNDFGAAPNMRGGLLTIQDYQDPGFLTCASLNGALELGTGSPVTGTWAATPILIQCFRWHQREFEIGEIRVWSQPRAYDDADPYLAARRRLSLHSGIDLDDASEPDLGNLLACWRCDGAEGALIRELVRGGVRNGFMAPFSVATTEGGERGKNLLFVSGEGEAPCFDLSTNPVFMREVAGMLAGSSQGFAMELSCVFTEAFYAIQDASITAPDKSTTGNTIVASRPRFVPEILSWDVKAPTASGLSAKPRPLLTLTHRGLIATTAGNPFNFPMGFSVEVAHRTDQEDVDPIVPSDLQPFYLDGTNAPINRYSNDAGWVGRHVTIQVGVQLSGTGTTDEYDVYIALSPKDAFLPASADPSDCEFAYWTKGGTTYSANADYQGYFSAAHLKIRAKDLVRSVITLGRWNCGTLGYAELQPRMLVDELRIFGCSASGNLPTANGGVLTARDGKLEGTNALPGRELTPDDILRPVGPGLSLVNVNEDSVQIDPPALSSFFTAEARASLNAVKGTYLYVPGDPQSVPARNSTPTSQEELYLVSSVATGGASLSLAGKFESGTRLSVSGRSLRLLAYCSFADDIRDKGLTLGSGKAFNPGTTTVADVIQSENLWTSGSPLSGLFGLRVYSPLGKTPLSSILPRWARGLVSCRTNRILGLIGQNEKRYAAVQGALFEVDDRWRADGPTRTIRTSLAFRAGEVLAGVTRGLQADRVEFQTPWALTPASDDSKVTLLDCWINPDELREYQTVLWVGDPNTDPSLAAGASLHRIHCTVRLNRGRPQIVFGSTATATGGTPEKGLFVATGTSPVPRGTWVHIRWIIPTTGSGATIRTPFLKVNGKRMSVAVNARDSGIGAPAADGLDWLRASTIVSSGANGRTLLGVSHDSYRSPDQSIGFTGTTLGTNIPPQRIAGYLHSLDGLLSRVTVSKQTAEAGSTTGTDPADFDPNQLSYAGATVQFDVLGSPEGVGHKLYDAGALQYGVIVSHPFISLYHALGSLGNQASIVEYEKRIYATTGSHVARIQNGIGGPAGVPAPTTAPSFRLTKLPLWRPNVRGLSTGAGWDPVYPAAPGAADQVNHYDNHGNNYVEEQLAAGGFAETLYTKDGSGFRYFGFKCYLKPRTVAGRCQIAGRRDVQGRGGPWIECVDGKVRVGWYDLYLKKDVYVETSEQVLFPGRWHLLYLRKKWQPDTLEGNWTNQYFTTHNMRHFVFSANNGLAFQIGELVNGGGGKTGVVTKTYGAGGAGVEIVKTGVEFADGDVLTGAISAATGTIAAGGRTHPMNDMLVVTRMRTAAGSGNDLTVFDDAPATKRNCVSFTTNALGLPAGTTANGLVTPQGIQYSGNATAGQVVAAYGQPFSDAMLGKFWQWGTGSIVGGIDLAGKLYRISQVVSATTINTVLAESSGAGSAEVFNGIANKAGGVFTGVALLKSTDFDASKMPDDQAYNIQAFGSIDAADPLSGMQPFDGEFGSFGWTSIVNSTGENAHVFEDVLLDASVGGAVDAALVGTDALDVRLYDGAGGSCGELRFDPWLTGPTRGTFACYDGRTYANAGGGVSSQPTGGFGADQTISLDTTPACSTNAKDLVWRFLQDLPLDGVRYARAVFYDVDQAQLSDPGPAVAIRPDEDDISNASRQLRLTLSDIPAPRDQGNFEVWLYLGLGGGSDSSLFRVARVPAGTREIVVSMPETTLGAQPPISFQNASPPRCEILAACRTRLFFGALESDPDSGVYSYAGTPVAVNFSAPFRLPGGLGPKLTMMSELDGLVVLGKRRALGSLTIDQNGLPVVDVVSSGVGCIAHQTAQELDDRLIFQSERGLCLVTRSGVTNLGKPTFIANNVRDFFATDIDQSYTHQAACINRRREQYVLALRATGEQRSRLRLSMDYDRRLGDQSLSLFTPSAFRFSRYIGPNVCALASVQSNDGGVAVTIAGTEEGFVVWMDREDTQLLGLGPSVAWGDATLVNSGSPGSVLSVAVGSGVVDTALEGPRGTALRYKDASGVVRVADILGASGSTLMFATAALAVAPANAPMVLGQQTHTWETGWVDCGNPERPKQAYYLDVIGRIETSGTMQVDIYQDFDSTTVIKSFTFQLSDLIKHYPVSDLLARWVKVVMHTPDISSGQRFEIPSLVLSVQDIGQD